MSVTAPQILHSNRTLRNSFFFFHKTSPQSFCPSKTLVGMMEYVIDSILFFIFYFFGLWVRHHFSVCDHFCKALVSTNLMHIIIKHVCIYKYLPIVLIFFNSKTVHLNFFVFLFFCCCFFCGRHIRLDGFRLYSNSVEIWCLKVLARQVEKCCW